MIPDSQALVSFDARTGLWTLHNDLVVSSLGWTLHVPAGFTSDLSSIPRELWSLIAPFELTVEAPLVHDTLYETGGQITILDGPQVVFTKDQADAFLRDIAKQGGVSAYRYNAAFFAVQEYGAKDWKTPRAA